MTRKTTKPAFPLVLAHSTLGTVLVSVTAVWLAAASYAPVTAPDAARAQSSHSHQLYRLSPIPAGADWTS
jgi:hypothetical protein